MAYNINLTPIGVTKGGTGTTTQFTSGSVVFAGSSGVYSQDNANLFWDDTNNRLGIGTTTPGEILEIRAPSGFPQILVGTSGNANGGLLFGSSSHGIKRDSNNVSVFTTSGNVNLSADGSSITNPVVISSGGALAVPSSANFGSGSNTVTVRHDGTVGVVQSNVGNLQQYVPNGTSFLFIVNATTRLQVSGTATSVTGDLSCTGTLSKGGGSFTIDHPLDPLNKKLQHSFVESPDMMNIYNGIVELDENGEAQITMPEWFSILNKDFKYQLTCIGAFAPIYISQQWDGTCFKIAGGVAGLQVSWQMTGIRNDRFAQAHPIQTEVVKDKPGYIHPDLFE